MNNQVFFVNLKLLLQAEMRQKCLLVHLPKFANYYCTAVITKYRISEKISEQCQNYMYKINEGAVAK